MAAQPRTLTTAEYLPAGDFPVAVRYHPEVPPGMLHAHEFSELVLVTGGTGRHVTGPDSWQLSAGDAFVLTGSREHLYDRTDRLSLYNILYDEERLGLTGHDLGQLGGYHALFKFEPAWRRRHSFRSRLHLGPEELTRAEVMVRELSAELSGRQPGYACMAAALFTQLVCFLSRQYGRARNGSSRELLRLGGVLAHLEQNYDQPAALDGLAKMSGMSRRSFQRAFREATGTSPIDYLVRLRVARAAALLREGGGSVTRIALACGFSDSNYFARTFRRLMGQTPVEYRRANPGAGSGFRA
jgi:AraC-like DNA-binding protein